MISRVCRLLLVLLLACAARAGGWRQVDLPSIPHTLGTITIDGKLDDWAGIEARTFLPVDPSQSKEASAAVVDLQEHPRSVAWRVASDEKALYLALEWQAPPGPASDDREFGSERLELHLRADYEAHLLLNRPEPNSALVLKWYNQMTGPTPVLDATVASKPTPLGYTEELRIPWHLISSAGQPTGDWPVTARPGHPPANGHLALTAEFHWASLGPARIAELPLDLRRIYTHRTLSFLTAPARLYNQGYLPNPQDWGDFVFTGAPRKPAVQASALATGLLELDVAHATAPPAIDGNLGDWDQAAFAKAHLTDPVFDFGPEARLSARFDERALYLAAAFPTRNRPDNRVHEASQAGFGGGDALQLRISAGEKVVNLCGWYDSLANELALTADGKDLPNPFLRTQGAVEAFKLTESGYTQEIAIPWQALGLTPPHVGDRWKATFQPWWAGLDGGFTMYAETTLAKPAPLTVPYHQPADGEVTLGLYDAQGGLLRWLTQSEFRREGDQKEPWDGLDQWGKPVPAGRYTVKAAWHPPLTLEHRLTVGNPGNPPWPTADGRGDWLSDEAPPQAVVTDGEWVFLAAPGSEKGFSIIALDGNGQRQWGVGEEFYPRCVSLALDGDVLYALYSGPELTDTQNRYTGKNAEERALLVCLDKRTGKPARFSREKPQAKLATWPYLEKAVGLWELRSRHGFTPAAYGGQPRYFADDMGEATGALGVAVAGGRVYVARNDLGKLLVYDAQTAAPLPAADLDLPAPAGLHALPDGKLLAVSGTQVVTVDPATKAVTPLVREGLVAPDSVTTDRAGNVYVSDWGTSFQVKVFSPAGRLLRAIGKPGGRPWVGTWDPSGMLVPRGIAVTSAGRLWVAEDDTLPKRVSVWDAASGRLVHEYLGPTPYGGGTLFCVDPQDATTVYSSGLRWKVDEAHKTATPVAVVTRRMSREQPFALNAHGCIVSGQQIVRHGGHEYLVANGHNMLVMMMRKGAEFVPVAACGSIQRYITDDGTGLQVWDSDLRYHMYRNWFPESFRGHAGHLFAWSDANADGLVQPDEIQWTDTLQRGEKWVAGRQTEWLDNWGSGFGPDWSLYYTGFCRDKTVVQRVDLAGWTAGGAPRYDMSQARLLLTDDRVASINGLYVNAENKLFVAWRYEGNEGKGATDALTCLDRDGKVQWRVAMPATRQRRDVHMENVIGEFNLPGLGHVLGTWLWHGNYRPYLLTSDGLYVGTLLDDTKLGPTGLWDESYKYYYQTPAGEPYLVNGGNQGNHLLHIGGLREGGRFMFPLTVTPDQVAAAAAARAVPVAKAPTKPVLRVTWQPTAPTVDGDLSDWNLDDGVDLGGLARVALRRDATNLYLAYRVAKPAAMVNQGQNWQTLFITGDCVDLMLATDPKADPHRRGAVAGDQRLLFSSFGGQPTAVLYRPVVPGVAGQAVQLMAARFDSIERLTDAQVKIAQGNGFYTVEAAVPWKRLGLDPTATADLRGDVGVIVADDTGRSRARRVYYYNQDTQITADLTTEATLQPSEWGAVELPLGPNQLRNGGFEQPLAAKTSDGWCLEFEHEGATARLVEGGRSGRQSLLLEQTKPVTFPATAYALPDYGDFMKTANDGRGAANVSVAQVLPVQAGHHYALRLWYRAEGLVDELKQPGKTRGYAAFMPWVYWPGAKQNGALWVRNQQHDVPDWTVLLNAEQNYWGVPRTYLAPEGATSAVVALKMTAASEAANARVWVDDVELVQLD